MIPASGGIHLARRSEPSHLDGLRYRYNRRGKRDGQRTDGTVRPAEEDGMVSTTDADEGARLRTRNIEDERRLDTWERKAQLPIVASALLPIVFGLAGTESMIADAVLIVAWGVFIADLVVHLRLVPRFLRTRWG